jgi:acyl-coenzyme A thioesterase PaaI-like protein
MTTPPESPAEPPRASVSPDTPAPEPTGPRDDAARERAGRALRDLGHTLVGNNAPVTVIEAVAEQLEALTAALDTGTVRSRAEHHHRGDWGDAPGDGEEMTSYADRPISGRSSPLGLDMTITRRGDEVVADFTLRAAHEGAPGRSHGGVIAAMFDDIYGFVLEIHRQPAFTGWLTTHFLAPTPIGEPLEARVRLAERNGRKLTMTGELTAVTTGAMLARSEALFIAIDVSYFLGAD